MVFLAFPPLMLKTEANFGALPIEIFNRIRLGFIADRLQFYGWRFDFWNPSCSAPLVGGKLMGILGALLALPVAAALIMLIEELRVELPGQQKQSSEVKQCVADVRAEEVRAPDGRCAYGASRLLNIFRLPIRWLPEN